MQRRVRIASIGVIGIALGLLGIARTTQDITPSKAAALQPMVQAVYGQLPLSFEANRGQTDPQVQFLSRGRGYSLFLTPTEAVLTLKQVKAEDSSRLTRHASREHRQTVLRMKLLGADPASRITGLNELPGKTNYFVGDDPKKWQTNVPTYAKVKYEQVYPGVDLVYYGNQRQLEYDLVVAPGTDPKQIRLTFSGADRLEVDAQGDLVLHVSDGNVRLHKPLVYQEVDGTKQFIAGHYALKNNQQVGFQVAAYDSSRPLIIDPVLSYSTYLGGSIEDRGYGIAVDSSGAAYVTGIALSLDFPMVNAFQPNRGNYYDVFVAKLAPAGNALVYSTYLGGNGSDRAFGITVDTSGSAYVTGDTESADFPVANAFQPIRTGTSDAYVVKLAPSGSSLDYSTYLGGSNGEIGTDIAVDISGNVYVTGYTDSTDFPTMNPLQAANGGGSDAFITKLNPDGSVLIYSTYLGGGGGNSFDRGNSIAVDASGYAYVTGSTSSTNFPTFHALQSGLAGSIDTFVTKLTPTGKAFVYSTYLGGYYQDSGLAIAADRNGNAYVTGTTLSWNFPVANPLQQSLAGSYDAFVTKLTADGSALAYSTYFGGSSGESGYGIDVDGAGHVYVTGYTASGDFPTVRPLPYNGGHVFVAKLIPTGDALVYSTRLGGSRVDVAHAIAVDISANAYITGEAESTDFPTVNAFQPTNVSSAGNAFIAKLSDDAPDPVPPPRPNNRRVEQDDLAVGYNGTWYTDTAPGHSGGSAAFSQQQRARAVLTFSGTGVKWIGSRDQWSGIAAVYLDNVFQGNVDTYSLESQYQAELFAATDLAPGTHTIAIEATGTHNPVSAQAWIWVDAFDVIGETSPPSSDIEPPTVTMTAPANGAIVSGTITISADAADNVGVAGVQFYVDGTPLGAEDTEAPYAVAWDTTGIIAGIHKLTAVARDAAGNSGTSAAVTVTVANVVPGLPRLP